MVHKPGERKLKSKSAAKMDQALQRAVKAVVTVNRELHAAASDRSCRHIELDVKGRGVQYSTGDHIAILARNRCVTDSTASGKNVQASDAGQTAPSW